MRKTIVSITTLVATLLFATASFAGPFTDSLSSSKKSLSTNATKGSPATKYAPPPTNINPSPAPPYVPPPAKSKLNPGKVPNVVDRPPTVPPLSTPLPPPKPTPMPPPVADKGGHGHGHHHHHGYPYLGFGLAAAGIAAAAAAPTVVEYVQQPIYAPAPVASPYAPASAPVQALPAPAMENPFDAFVGRLNGLTLALQQGLITKDEYRAQRQAVMASLDAGQVSRTVGMQDGLRQLKMMADGGVLTPREYDDKRKEFVLYL